MNRKSALTRAGAVVAALAIAGTAAPMPASASAANSGNERVATVAPVRRGTQRVAQFGGFEIVTHTPEGRPWPWWIAAGRQRPSQSTRRRRRRGVAA